MKNIIVAVDFSDSSITALEHAITIAHKGGFGIQMVWVNNPTTTRILLSDAQSDDLVAEVDNQFKTLITRYMKEAEGVSFTHAIREGKVYQQISQLARQSEAFLIVAGTHGASGFEEFWIGSNANKIVSAAPCPVITIRGGVSVSRDLKRIIVPVDSTPETRQKSSFTASIARLFEAEIFIVGWLTSGIGAIHDTVENYALQMKTFFEEEELLCRFEMKKAENIALATIDYALDYDANLISIMTEQETTTANLWLGPFAQQLVNRSPVPVLSIHPIDFNADIYS
ncbi:MAG TPA: universal stress protein [Bacteroidales bacterium]|nr:universal stress protein [Bacteroidales bacterium]